MGLLSTLVGMSKVVTNIGTGFQTVGNIAGAVWDWISDKVSAVIDFIVSIFDKVGEWWESWGIGDLWDGIVDIVSGAIDIIIGIFQGFGDFVSAWFELSKESLGFWFGLIETGITSVLGWLEPVFDWFSVFWDFIVDGWNLWSNLVNVGISTLMGWLQPVFDWFSELWSYITDEWEKWSALVDVGVNVLLSVFDSISVWWNDFWTLMSVIWTGIENIFESTIGYLIDLFQDLWNDRPNILKLSWWKNLFDFSWFDFGAIFDIDFDNWTDILPEWNWNDIIPDTLSNFFTLDNLSMIWESITGIFTSFFQPIKDVINKYLIGTINDVLNWDPDYVPGGKIKNILGVSTIPKLAKGGIATGPESGYPVELHGTEAVVPLPDGRSIPVEMQGNSGNQTFNITVEASGITDRTDKRAMARDIGNMIQQELARTMGGSTNRGRFA